MNGTTVRVATCLDTQCHDVWSMWGGHGRRWWWLGGGLQVGSQRWGIRLHVIVLSWVPSWVAYPHLPQETTPSVSHGFHWGAACLMAWASCSANGLGVVSADIRQLSGDPSRP